MDAQAPLEVEPDVNPNRTRSTREYDPSPVVRAEHAESTLTRLIEQQSAKIPSDFFLFTALTAMAASLAFELSGRTRLSRFVGQWPPALLMMGMYNKLLKMIGTR